MSFLGRLNQTISGASSVMFQPCSITELRAVAKLCCLAPLLAVTPAFATEVESAGQHGPDFSSLTWYVINFLLYAVLIRTLYFKKGAPYLEQRAAQVKQHIEKATLDLSRSEENLVILQQRLKQIAVEKSELIESYEREAHQMGTAIIEQAHTASRRIAADAKRQADSELSQAQKQLRHEVVTRAMALAKSQMEQGLSAEDDRRLRGQILREALF